MKYRYLILLILVCGTLGAGCASLDLSGGKGAPSPSASGQEIYKEGSSGTYPANVRFVSDETDYGSAEQKLIKTGSVSLEVGSVIDSVETLKGMAERYQGYLSSSSISGASADRLSASVVVRIPAESFDAAVREIKTLGALKSEAINAQDITQEYVDLQAQKAPCGVSWNSITGSWREPLTSRTS